MIRVGLGYDVHQLVPNRPLILGGVTIPYSLGLDGHSDADVLSHAITDALLGALAWGSIGDWFPDTDPNFKNADSLVLLRHVVTAIQEKGYAVGNVDAVIMAQEPKLMPYVTSIQTALAGVLDCPIDAVGLKATTTEHLGFVGRKEGMAAQAIVLLTHDRSS